ncbi:bcl2-associated agonist of cell death isoform X2 [Alligator mississippiensis]|nr:bcl2-associated agonist of cell death isoform X2 [Alligator mississippiensis]
MFRLEEFPEEDACPGPGTPGTPETTRGGAPSSPSTDPRTRLPSAPSAAEPTEPGTPQFRGRSRSAPPVLWAAARFGRELRRMSDEFDVVLQVLPRPRSAGTGWREALQGWWGRRPPHPSPPRGPP